MMKRIVTLGMSIGLMIGSAPQVALAQAQRGQQPQPPAASPAAARCCSASGSSVCPAEDAMG